MTLFGALQKQTHQIRLGMSVMNRADRSRSQMALLGLHSKCLKLLSSPIASSLPELCT